MDIRLHYHIVTLLVIIGLHICSGNDNFSKNAAINVLGSQVEPSGKDHVKLDGSAMVDAQVNVIAPPSPVPSSASVKSTVFSTPPIPPSMSTFTMPQPATATSSPGGNNASKIINLLFAILLVVTAILMAITGACMMGLRRRYLIVSEQPRYQQLKTVPV